MKKWSVGLFSCLTAFVFVFLIMAEGSPALLFHDLDCPAGASAGREDCKIEENAEQTDPSERGSQSGPAGEAETAAGSHPVTGGHAEEGAGTVPVAESGFSLRLEYPRKTKGRWRRLRPKGDMEPCLLQSIQRVLLRDHQKQ